MRKNLTGTEPYGRLPTPSARFVPGSADESLQTQVLTDPALMLVLSPFAAGGSTVKTGGKSSWRLRKLRCEQTRRHSHREIARSAAPRTVGQRTAAGWPRPDNAAPPPGPRPRAPIPRQLSSVGSSGKSTGWRRWREVRMGAKRVVESAIHIQPASFQILGQLLARRLRVDRRGVQ